MIICSYKRHKVIKNGRKAEQFSVWNCIVVNLPDAMLRFWLVRALLRAVHFSVMKWCLPSSSSHCRKTNHQLCWKTFEMKRTQNNNISKRKLKLLNTSQIKTQLASWSRWQHSTEKVQNDIIYIYKIPQKICFKTHVKKSPVKYR